MTARDFLTNIVAALPSRGVDSTDIYIGYINSDEEFNGYRISEITNDGNNDAVFIYIEKED